MHTMFIMYDTALLHLDDQSNPLYAVIAHACDLSAECLLPLTLKPGPDITTIYHITNKAQRITLLIE